MSHWITLVTPYGRMNGWLAEPDDKPNGGIVLVHDVFGVNGDRRRVADRYAEQGYLTLVPSLFDNIRREVELDYGEENQKAGAALTSQLGLEIAAALVNTAVDAIGHAGKVAVIGYGWGGTVALRSVLALSLPWISYYGAGDSQSLENDSFNPALLHHGDKDRSFSPVSIRLHQERLPALQRFVYPTGHGFDRAGDAEHFHAESSELALRRTQDFLATHIRHENA